MLVNSTALNVVCRIIFTILVLSKSVKCHSSFPSFVNGKLAENPSKYGNKEITEKCFCDNLLEEPIGDCECNVAYVDSFNNKKIFPVLASLLFKSYFRFYKVNLFKKCPFWDDTEGKCSFQNCAVKECPLDSLPAALKAVDDNLKLNYKPPAKEEPCTSSREERLSSINDTISTAASENIATWQEHDAKMGSYCAMDEEQPDDQTYVDLTLNPERYTGYKGREAHKIWRAIYEGNCFKTPRTHGLFSDTWNVEGMCFEERIFYRAISGLHTSISMHVSLKYLQPTAEISNVTGNRIDSIGTWGPNIAEFHKRFNPTKTNGNGPEWLRNLYLLYLLELRALEKAAPYLETFDYYTGNSEEDIETKEAVQGILRIIKSFEHHFDETTMFFGGQEAIKRKNDFRLHFYNVSRIMDCVGCQKCRLWGKLQIQGLGTAVKILFSPSFEAPESTVFNLKSKEKAHFKLTRNEVVALFNGFGRLSESIHGLEIFRKLHWS